MTGTVAMIVEAIPILVLDIAIRLLVTPRNGPKIVPVIVNDKALISFL